MRHSAEPGPNTKPKQYTRWLATHHYENFHVVSFLLPKHLHQDFYNVYAFCRWSDDLGDEIPDKAEALRLLAWWRGLLDRLYDEAMPGIPSTSLFRRQRVGTTFPSSLFLI